MWLAFDRWRINDLGVSLMPLAATSRLRRQRHVASGDVVERLVIQRKLRRGAHPVLQWCAANAVVTRDPAGGRKFDKAKSSGRIARWWRSRWRCSSRFSEPQSQPISRPHRLMPELAAPRASQLSRMRMPQMARSRPSRASLIQRHRIGLA